MVALLLALTAVWSSMIDLLAAVLSLSWRWAGAAAAGACAEAGMAVAASASAIELAIAGFSNFMNLSSGLAVGAAIKRRLA